MNDFLKALAGNSRDVPGGHFQVSNLWFLLSSGRGSH
jgi:hypothetical protein